MAEAVPGTPDGGGDEEEVEEIDDLAGQPVAPPGKEQQAEGGGAPSPRRLSPRSKARPRPPPHFPPAHRLWEAAA
eukprot:8090341-Alexandrium_andersonii.AAC.1